METGHYIPPSEVIFLAAGFAGDIEFKIVPKGFYYTLIQDAFRDLNFSSLWLDRRYDFVIDETLKFLLPEDCVNVEAVYAFNGDVCNIERSKRVYWKRNYYNRGGSYIANNKAENNGDPYIVNTSSGAGAVRNSNSTDTIHNGLLFYEIENNELRISQSCRNYGTKIHIKYKSSGGRLEDMPIIPVFAKEALVHYVTEGILMFRAANEPSNLKNIAPLLSMYSSKLDKNGMNGSWHKAISDMKRMSRSKMDDLKTYIAKGPWATGR